MKRRTKKTKAAVGWREWVALPELGVDAVKAKIDTGARTSSLHAVRIRTIVGADGAEWIRFDVHPLQRRSDVNVTAEVPLVERRLVRSSDGHEALRPVIRTTVDLFGARWPIELTLVSRATMGFRMLLGREAIRRRFLVDPGRSFLAGGARPSRPSSRRDEP